MESEQTVFKDQQDQNGWRRKDAIDIEKKMEPHPLGLL
jgi:hypothetical protein